MIRRCLILVIALLASAVSFTGLSQGSAVAADADGPRMILLLDSSGSMKEQAGGGQTKIAAAKSAPDRPGAVGPRAAVLGPPSSDAR